MAIPRYRGLAATPPKPKVARAADPAPREERISDVAPIGTHARTERPSGTATRPSGERVAVRLPSPGDLLAGRYRIVRPLGRGGMSVVYEAFHARTEAQVAVKVLYPELLQKDEAVRRFLRESRALSRLHSPHVVQVLDADTTEAGLPFTVMELLSGQDLGDVWAGTSPPLVRDVAEYVAQACVGLAAAHAAGIVHRDVKPGNLFLAEEGDTKRVKLIDFGVAKLRERCSTGLVTRHGETIGTPLYMAPEQIRAKPVDGRADVWALGVVMYRVLSGRTPFEGKSDQQYLLAVIEQTPRHLAELRPDLPRALADVVMKALAQNVDARHADAMALADALAPFRAAAPAAAPRAPAAP
ncbi:MAG: serine/threonine protein kinase, partial [Myxococcales bacterium]|nr:serine/threonine protein kinase [Myxococcales bacterium]